MRWILLCGLCLLFAGVGAAQDEVIGPDVYPQGINPLTGLPVDDPAVLEQRPLIVKVINAPAEVRPQYGLMQADIVWEHLLAGGITRFAAIYLSQAPEVVGPIRSVRLVDFELVRIYRALLSGSGMATGTYDIMIRDADAPSRIIIGAGPCPALCRDGSLNEKLEYTLFGNVPAIRTHAEELERDTTPQAVNGMAFSETPPENGITLNSLRINYRNTDIVWTWDAGRWLRAQDGEPHLSANTDEPLNAANVLILEDNHIEQPFVSEGYWGPPNFAFSVNFIGRGRAILLRDGAYHEGEWRREAQDGVLTFYDAAGNVLPFKPGNTFFNLMPRWVNGYSLEFDAANAATGTITASSVNLRWGPSTNYSAADAGYRGDEVAVIGRNNSGTWVQLRKDERVVWMSRDFIDVDTNIMALPLARPTVEN